MNRFKMKQLDFLVVEIRLFLGGWGGGLEFHPSSIVSLWNIKETLCLLFSLQECLIIESFLYCKFLTNCERDMKGALFYPSSLLSKLPIP